MQTLIQIDHFLFFFINRTMANPVFDLVMPFVTRLKNVLPLLLLACLALLIWGGKKGRIAVLVLILSIALADMVSHEVIKPLFGRLRPCVALEGVRMLMGKKTSLSFPSNHAANITAAAVVISYYYRRVTGLMVAMALMIGFSRIYVGVHYPSDVAAGALLGGAVAAGILFAVIQAGRKWKYLHLKEGAGKPSPESHH